MFPETQVWDRGEVSFLEVHVLSVITSEHVGINYS